MNCPACDRVLVPRDIGGLTVDICDGGCGGLWFDAFEIGRLDEQLPRELKEVATDPDLVVDRERKRNCPRCEGIKMQRHFYSRTHRVEIDSCPGCNGYWLDAGELEAIRSDVEKKEPGSGPIRVHLQKKPSATPPQVGSGGLSRADRACTLGSLYDILGSKY